ncbi:hypothetical protein KIN20_015822 [Parelaphostrongylus tenuis]|uniref:Uncharacterized protein n=1 Tax=Parelaphostrongylus tenuis TaxID=148309 RepID=A0AAD5QQ64_PARTN|nr:hypothetical protein KIN20_015822 [Parelaphostrongylus tenuis]
MEHLRKLFKSYDQRESEDGGERGPVSKTYNPPQKWTCILMKFNSKILDCIYILFFSKKDEQELLPLTEVLHHRDFRNACKMMTEIKNRKMIDRLLNANDSGIIRKMFENDIIEPTKVVRFDYCGLMKGYEGQQRIPDDDGAGLIHPPIVRTVSSHWTKQLQQVLIEQKLKGQEQTFSVRAETEQVAERNMKAISDKAIDPQVNNVDEGVALKAVDSEENQVAELTKRRKMRKKKQSRSRKLTRRTTTTVDQQMTAKTSDDPYLQREKISDKKGVKDSIGASCKSPEIKILKTEKEERNGIEHVATTQNSTSLKEMLPKSSDDKFGDPKERPKIGGGINRPESPETDERQTQEGDMEESINKELKDFSAKDKDEKKDTMSELTGKSQKERRNEKPEITLEVTKEQLDKKQMTEDEIEKRKEEKMSV